MKQTCVKVLFASALVLFLDIGPQLWNSWETFLAQTMESGFPSQVVNDCTNIIQSKPSFAELLAKAVTEMGYRNIMLFAVKQKVDL